MYCGPEEGTTSDVMIMIMMIVACLVMAAVSFEGWLKLRTVPGPYTRQVPQL